MGPKTPPPDPPPMAMNWMQGIPNVEGCLYPGEKVVLGPEHYELIDMPPMPPRPPMLPPTTPEYREHNRQVRMMIEEQRAAADRQNEIAWEITWKVASFVAWVLFCWILSCSV